MNFLEEQLKNKRIGCINNLITGLQALQPITGYFDIADTYGGTVVNMSTYTDNYVNPLEMDVWSLDPNDSKGMVREKGEFMHCHWSFS